MGSSMDIVSIIDLIGRYSHNPLIVAICSIALAWVVFFWPIVRLVIVWTRRISAAEKYLVDWIEANRGELASSRRTEVLLRLILSEIRLLRGERRGRIEAP